MSDNTVVLYTTNSGEYNVSEGFKNNIKSAKSWSKCLVIEGMVIACSLKLRQGSEYGIVK